MDNQDVIIDLKIESIILQLTKSESIASIKSRGWNSSPTTVLVLVFPLPLPLPLGRPN
jgi:hypothetical protein